MLNRNDAEAAKTILQAAGWKDIAICDVGEYPGWGNTPFPVYSIEANQPPGHICYKSKSVFSSLRDAVTAAQETPIEHHRGNLETVIFKATNLDEYSDVCELASKNVLREIVSWYSALAKLLRQYADSPNAIRLIADNIDGKR